MASNVRPGARGASASGRDPASQLVFDMDADDVVECRFHLEAECEAAARIEAAWPAGHNAFDQFVRCTLDAPGDLVAVSYTHLRAHETRHDLVCRLLLEKK